MEKIIFKYIIFITALLVGWMMFDFLFVSPREWRKTCANVASMTSDIELNYQACLRSKGIK